MANPNKSSISLARGRGHGRATQATVAQHAGVTTMTVSRYLQEPARVAPATAKRIAAALALTGYTRNKHAGMLASGRSNMVAAIIPGIASAIFADTVQGLSDSLQGRGMELLLASTNYSLQREEEQIRAVLGWSPSGLVVTGRRHTATALALMQRARDAGLPVLQMWDYDPADQSFVQVGFSHPAVGAVMAQHLLQRGYRDLAYVDSGVPQDFRAHERAQAFAATAAAAGARVRLIEAPKIEPMAAGRHALASLSGGGLPRAVAFANDNLAAGAWLQAQERGINVPGTLALLGFGDFPIARQLGGGLCTVGVAAYQIGQVCGKQLFAAWDAAAAGRLPSRRHRVVAPRLLVRQSS